MANWFPIEGYEGTYEVSSEGEIRNAKSDTLLVPAENGAGYLTVSLSNQGIKKTHAVHILVATYHVANLNPELFTVVHHKDENRLNNGKDNLEWTTQQYNCEASGHKQAKTVTIESPESVLVEVTNVRQFAKEHRLNQSNLNQVTLGKRKSCKGWRLAYE